MSAETLPQYFLERVEQYAAGKVALRQKEFGIWQEFTWQDSYAQVRDLALGLLALGVERGDRVATVGDNDRFYLWAYLGLLAIGGVQVGLYTDAGAEEMAYVIDHSDAVVVFAKDQEQCDKLLEIRDRLPKVRRVIYWEERGLWEYDDPWLISFAAVQAEGRALASDAAARLATEVAHGRGDDLAVICYTSGTTGLPKGAMLTHANLVTATAAFNAVDRRRDSDNHVSLLPLGWIAEHVLGVAPHVMYGIIMNFPEAPETVRANVREIAPEGILYNSRLWDNLVGMVQVRINEASWWNRQLYQHFLPIGYRMADRRLNNTAPELGLRLAYAAGDLLIFGPLRDQLGLSRVRSAYTAGAALSPDAMRFFHALGINLKQIYGSTEVAGGATVHRDGDVRFASVGKPAPGIEVKIGEDGEILIAGPNVFQGYYKDQAATAKALYLDDAGMRWFRTGDAGYIDADGHVIYLDRVKDMVVLASGDSFSPQFIEGRLKFSQQAVEDVNRNLPPRGWVRRFVLMHKEFDADEAEMTRSRKLRRGFLAQRYQAIIDAMHRGDERVRVQAPVRYQDGREGFIETELRIMQL
jgi:long-chain acyl-CoA synthetase